MRIGLFNADLPAPGRKPGGVSVLVHRLANALSMRGHAVWVYSYSPAPPERQYDHVQLHPARLAHSRLGRMFVVPFLLNGLRTDDLDVLHLYGDDWFFVRRRVPTLRTFSGSALYEAQSADRLRRKVSQYATFPLELLASRLATSAYGLGPGVPAVYKTSGELDIGFTPPKLNGQARSPSPAILFVGSWSGRKRGSLIFEAFVSAVRPALPEAELWMVSDDSLSAPGVRHIVTPADDELAALYQRAWVFCLPSTYEGFGMPYLEAMSYGTPVVASPNPGALHVLGNSGAGISVPDKHLGSTLVRVLEDARWRSDMGRAATARAGDFSWERVTSEHEAAYEAAIDGSAAP